MEHNRQSFATRNPDFVPRIEVIKESKWDFLQNTRRKQPMSQDLHREGPVLKAEAKKNVSQAANGSLDSDVDDGSTSKNKIASGVEKSNFKTTAGSRAFIIYFAKLARAQDKELVDFDFVESLLEGGASVNSTDKHGQTALHETARNWHTDVAFFLLQHGADINKADKWGRTPLHSASAVNHAEMVRFFLQNGADINAKTNGELQSPIHYAAKFNAVDSLKVLIEFHANINDRDYKRRTPLFVAAETAREDTSRYLIEQGAPAGVFDDSGLSLVALLIEKMPQIAKDALEQFVHIDRAFRREYYYLNYLESDPLTWKDLKEMKDYKKQKKKEGIKVHRCPTTPLKVAVHYKQLDILMHPVMQTLINVKWHQYGKRASILAAAFHLTYILLWTWLAIFLPADHIYYYPPSKFWWRILFEIIGCLMTVYFILKQVWEVKSGRKEQAVYQTWRVRELEKDLKFCHPRWPNEKQYLESEIRRVQSWKTHYFKDAWNIMDWLTYIAVLLVITTRCLAVFSHQKQADSLHPKAYAIALIFMWFHFMKSCRPFTTLGPFISMLGHVFQDTLRFAFLFFEFFIPYVCAFWIIFGGEIHANMMKKEKQDPTDWHKFNDLTYSVWMVSLIANFNWNAIVAIDRLMAQVLVGTYFAIVSVVCMNLYIALLSDTFARVYENATANASLLQATTILQFEKALSDERRNRAEKHIQRNCSPLDLAHNAEHDACDESSGYQVMIRKINNRLSNFEDTMKEMESQHHESGPSDHMGFGGGKTRSRPDSLRSTMLVMDRDIQNARAEVRNIRSILRSFLSDKATMNLYNDSSPQSSCQSLVVPSIHGSSAIQRRNVSRSKINEESDLMRQVLNQKLQSPEKFETDSANKGNKRRRKKKKGKQTSAATSSSLSLSNSWEDVSEVGASLPR